MLNLYLLSLTPPFKDSAGANGGGAVDYLLDAGAGGTTDKTDNANGEEDDIYGELYEDAAGDDVET